MIALHNIIKRVSTAIFELIAIDVVSIFFLFVTIIIIMVDISILVKIAALIGVEITYSVILYKLVKR